MRQRTIKRNCRNFSFLCVGRFLNAKGTILVGHLLVGLENSEFKDFCRELGIKNHFYFPRHPQANGQTEVTNWTLLKIIKIRLKGA